MDKMLKPGKGKDGKMLKVFNPATKLFLKEEGQLIKMDKYWKRRLKDGDVVEAEMPKAKVIKKSKSEEK